jgi:hypothetical protein
MVSGTPRSIFTPCEAVLLGPPVPFKVMLPLPVFITVSLIQMPLHMPEVPEEEPMMEMLPLVVVRVVGSHEPALFTPMFPAPVPPVPCRVIVPVPVVMKASDQIPYDPGDDPDDPVMEIFPFPVVTMT